MTIRDNGFTLLKNKGSLYFTVNHNGTIEIEAKCLADLADWLEEAFEEVQAKIREDWVERQGENDE